jgi:hypothetical protein
MIKVLIIIIDGDVSDDEWNEFYATFYTPFVACDADKDNFLSSASEMLTCLTKSNFLIKSRYCKHLKLLEYHIALNSLNGSINGYFSSNYWVQSI